MTSLDDFSRLSEWDQKEELKLNLSKIARELNCDRKTVKKRLEGVIPKKTRKRKKCLDEFVVPPKTWTKNLTFFGGDTNC